ncbi:hypothetical protein [Sporocytophaga myxococcoides]|uniref:hypothetical protein n=1 Tax=Sporocytophaga myxococcoides TaxID=153721 RepID=UPI000410A994|nr:hypothetical protein [Sporocytophaga myxococcoides]
MKNYFNLLLFSFIIILSSCSGSDVYQGNWKATDTNGNKFEINFEPKKFSIKNVDGNIETFEYTQNSVKIENSVRTYGIKLSDGRAYNILLPMKQAKG